MEYLDGESFENILKRNHERIEPEEVLRLMGPVMDFLAQVHQKNIIHGDICPDNLIFDSEGRLKLVDFGNVARQDGKSMSIILKPGYSPVEQYSTSGKKGPWTDVYALCATMYRAITGKVPLESLDRLNGIVLPTPSAMGIQGLSEAQEIALMYGLGIQPDERFQNMEALRTALNQPSPKPLQPLQPPRPPRTVLSMKKKMMGVIGILTAILLGVVATIKLMGNSSDTPRSDKTVKTQLMDQTAETNEKRLSSMQTYTNDLGCFKLQYPEGYSVNEPSVNQVLITNGDDLRAVFYGEYGVVTDSGIAIYNADDYAKLIREDSSILEEWIGQEDLKLADCEQGTFSGRNCYRVTCTFKMNSENYYGELYFMDTEGDYGIYSLMWMVPSKDENVEEYKSICQNIKGSFDVTGKAALEDYQVYRSENDKLRMILKESLAANVEVESEDELRIYLLPNVYSKSKIWIHRTSHEESEPVVQVLDSLSNYYFKYKDDVSYIDTVKTVEMGRYEYAYSVLTYREAGKTYEVTDIVTVLDGDYWEINTICTEEYKESTMECLTDVLTSLNFNGKSGNINCDESQGTSGTTSNGSSSSSDGTASASSSGSYNIAEGLFLHASEGHALMDTTHFQLYMPNTGDWDYEVVNDTTISLYYTPSRDTGYGGYLVSLMAFDPGDNSYEDFPEYSVIARGSVKTYVALFPTDVQFSSEQQEGYVKLMNYLHRLDENDENNPFICWD